MRVSILLLACLCLSGCLHRDYGFAGPKPHPGKWTLACPDHWHWGTDECIWTPPAGEEADHKEVCKWDWKHVYPKECLWVKKSAMGSRALSK